MNLIGEGFIFMLVGMGMVFIFLVLMILVMNVSAGIISRFFPEKAAEESSAGSGSEKSKLAAVIAIAKSRQ
ncbi:oxaloacetate decarboxylase subunit gamma [Sedimentisphaera cyanobacteriorum]|uniref:Oxaloacetate decarboxylase subunit gamma n=1 Tax=Sedimentisphaera cyanobacteriorum TaxID=1940790 RepID=A0A1Q2HSP5_9BACT|nr:OadG family transporter subunit [Sedimentisphaera cyanobacteriorum]AQQ10390.1 oxaloacetate decarboxylase subunit gamma [Sedimentisphaera cyanobacteriorum]